MRRRSLLAATGAGLVAGCAGPHASQYAGEKPLLDLPGYFNGRLRAWGMFTDRSGAVRKRFTVALEGRWRNADEGVLDEAFTYSDGSTQRRMWHLQRTGEGRWRGIADDVVGAADGEQAGNALHWRYTLALPVDGRVWNVDFDDWMVLLDEQVLLNRAEMSKLGVRLGEVTLAFRKP